MGRLARKPQGGNTGDGWLGLKSDCALPLDYLCADDLVQSLNHLIQFLNRNAPKLLAEPLY